MGFRFICEHCGNDKFHVCWDITKGNTMLESALQLKCTKCGTEYVLTPTIQWELDNITHPNVEITDDKGRPIEFPSENKNKKNE